MKREAMVGFILIMLSSVSVFSINSFHRVNVDHGYSASSGVQSTTDEWPMFHHDLSHTGFSTSSAPKTNQTLWTYTVGPTVASMVQSSPAVVGGRVFVDSANYKVYALDAATGALLWNYTTGYMMTSSPAVANGVVYVGSLDGKVYALDATTGVFIWNYTTGNAVRSSPAVVDGKIYVGSDDCKVYVLNASSGALVWSYRTFGAVVTSPAVADGIVYVGSGQRIYALDAATGKQSWNYTFGYGVGSSPTVANGIVYVTASEQYCRIYALDATTGAKIWSYYTPNSASSTPAVAGGRVYFGCLDRNVYALDAATGALAWTYRTGATVASSPAVADGRVYVGSQDGKLYALDGATGALVWSYNTGCPGGYGVASSPAIVGGRVYVGSENGKVYAFGNTFAPRILFSGMLWDVKNTDVLTGPGPNYWSSSFDNVWVDENGSLHLKITHRDEKWYCAEVNTTLPLEYGRYVFYTASRIDSLDQNVVLGLFAYKDDHHEVDIEFSRWSNKNALNNTEYTIQPGPPENSTHQKSFNIELTGYYSTHFFSWNRNNVFFESFHGHYPPEIPPPLNIIQTWSCPVTRQAEGAKADINLWLYANRTSQGLPPSDGKEVEVVIKEFKFDAVPGDLNKDSKCDIKDVYILGLAYGSNSTKPNWNPIADVNSDGKVDKDDLTIISIDYAYQAGS